MDKRPTFGMPNRYRRAFDWRVSTPPSGGIATGLGGLSFLSRSDLPDILEDFLYVSRKRKLNRTAISKLQLYMLQEIVSQEALVKKYKQHLEGLEGTSQGQDIERETEHIKRELFMFRVYANAIRAIGDGIAWRALDYDRAVTRLMAEHATKQQIMSEGLMGELLEWSIRFDNSSGVALLNSLTNCLAVGDITVVNNDGSAEIVEVKSSNSKSRRKIRQKHKMREVVTLLSSGAGETSDKEVSIKILSVKPESGLDKIGALLLDAETPGWSAGKISNCLYVECFDFQTLESFDAVKKDVEVARKGAIGDWEERKDIVLDRNSMDLIAFSPNCAPFSIFPFSNRTCIDLLIGKKCYIGYLNLTAVAREFEYRGWKVIKTTEELWADGNKEASLIVGKGEFHVCIPPADFMKMHMEALRVQTEILACEAEFKEGPQGISGFLLHLYEEERNLWD